jgi:ParB-like chromosome segregation protein Spo0J
MNAFVRSAKYVSLPLDEIDLSDTIRPYNAAVVAEIAQSIRAIGLQTPLTCIVRGGQHVLVSGRNRLEALRTIGAEEAPVRIVDFDDVEAQLWRLSENLHRAELTKLEYDRQVVRYAELLKVKQAGGSAASLQPQPASEIPGEGISRQVDEKVSQQTIVRSAGRPRGWQLCRRARAQCPRGDGSPRLSDRLAIAGSAGSGDRDWPGQQSVRGP